MGRRAPAGTSRSADVGWRRLALRLLREGLKHGEARLPVVSASMWPLVRPGEWVRLGAVAPRRVRPGEVVCLRRGRALVLHRVVRREGRRIQTRGDLAPRPDPWTGEGSVLGRVTRVERRGLRRALNALPVQWPLWVWLGRIRWRLGAGRSAR